MIKRFLEWIGIKGRIHVAQNNPPFFKEGEIWWCYVGENVGVEVNGKGYQFTRPMLIFKKYDKYSFLGLPLTTKLKSGSWYAATTFSGRQQRVILSQGRVLDYRRFKEKIGQLEESELARIRNAYHSLHFVSIKNRPLAVSSESRGKIPNIHTW